MASYKVEAWIEDAPEALSEGQLDLYMYRTVLKNAPFSLLVETILEEHDG